ncbi:MAG: hypothetical protein M0D57_21355 [Sphingobacteriales bacterium JAD_PAG50586_3]|nr:MAG: hypothetical protein M0D57_21355 [Sphingobacteriales bacterium JAD_PAG50586_3]
MNKLAFIYFFTLLYGSLFSANTEIEIYSKTGRRFYLIIDGRTINKDKPDYNVKYNLTSPLKTRIEILFEGESSPALSKFHKPSGTNYVNILSKYEISEDEQNRPFLIMIDSLTTKNDFTTLQGSYYIQTYKGFIFNKSGSKIPITALIRSIQGEITGKLFYDRLASDLTLSGTISGNDIEFTEGRDTLIGGIYAGRQEGDSIIGKFKNNGIFKLWKSNKDYEVLKYDLRRSYFEGAYSDTFNLSLRCNINLLPNDMVKVSIKSTDETNCGGVYNIFGFLNENKATKIANQYIGELVDKANDDRLLVTLKFYDYHKFRISINQQICNTDKLVFIDE